MIEKNFNFFFNPISKTKGISSTLVVNGILQEECSLLIKDFFASKRN